MRFNFWTTKKEERWTELLIGIIFNRPVYDKFQEEQEHLSKEREDFVLEEFEEVWDQYHIESTEEQKKVGKIEALCWFKMGFNSGASLPEK
jgi:hypothetical protein